MTNTSRTLYIIFRKSGTVGKLLKEIQSRPWTVLKSCQPNDVGLLYVGGDGGKKIWGIAVAAENSEQGVPDKNWTDSDNGFFARHSNVHALKRPISLNEVRRKFPDWGLWTRLSGYRACGVPIERRKALANWIVSKNSDMARILSPWTSRNDV